MMFGCVPRKHGRQNGEVEHKEHSNAGHDSCEVCIGDYIRGSKAQAKRGLFASHVVVIRGEQLTVQDATGSACVFCVVCFSHKENSSLKSNFRRTISKPAEQVAADGKVQDRNHACAHERDGPSHVSDDDWVEFNPCEASENTHPAPTNTTDILTFVSVIVTPPPTNATTTTAAAAGVIDWGSGISAHDTAAACCKSSLAIGCIVAADAAAGSATAPPAVTTASSSSSPHTTSSRQRSSNIYFGGRRPIAHNHWWQRWRRCWQWSWLPLMLPSCRQ
jgi:hypothetical protein